METKDISEHWPDGPLGPYVDLTLSLLLVKKGLDNWKANTVFCYFFQIITDEEIVDMSDGFPKFEIKGSKKLFTFRIPKFNNTVVIDPTVNVAGSEGGGEVSGGEGGGGGEDTTTAIPTTIEGDTSSASLPSFKLMCFGFLVSVATMFAALFNIWV